MAFIRSIDVISKKWADVTPGRSKEYESGVSNPRRPWMEATVNAEGAYEEGVSAAITKKRFGRGVREAGNQAWLDGAVKKGVSRWGPGVRLGVDKYRKGFAPYRDAIERTVLPPRYARRDPRNLERVRAVVDALVAAKEATAGM